MTGGFLLTEAGGALLLESGGHLLLEDFVGTPSVFASSISHHKTLEAAFTSLPSDSTYVWTDLSGYLRDGSNAISTRRGRQESSQKFAPGQASFLLDNRYADFDPLNPNARFLGNLLPMVPIRYGLEAPWLPGLLADGGFRRGVSEWVTLTNCTATWVSPPHADPVFTGKMSLASIASSATFSARTKPVATSHVGSRLSCSARLTPTPGTTSYSPSCYMTVLFYSDVAGTALITSATTSGAFADSQRARIEVDAIVPASTQSVRVEIGLTSPAGSHTLIVDSVVVDYCDVNTWAVHFQGYATDWDITSAIGDSTCALVAEDGIKNVGLAGMTSPLYGDYLATLSPTHWYRLGETVPNQSYVKTTSLKDSATGRADASVFVDAGVGPLMGADGASPTDPDFSFSIIGPSSSDAGHILTGRHTTPAGNQWTMSMWVRSTDGVLRDFTSSPFNDYNLLQLYDDAAGTGTVPLFRLQVIGQHSDLGAAGVVFALWNDYSLLPTSIRGASAVGSQNVVVDELWHQIVLTYNASTNSLLLYVDGLLDRAGSAASGGGFTVGASYQVKIGGGATIQTVPGIVGAFEVDEFMVWDGRILTPTEVSAMYVRGFEEYPQETSLARVNRALDLAKWPTSLRDIDVTRGVQVQHVTSPFAQDNALQYVQLVEDTEQGMVYVDRAGNVAARDHEALINAQSTAIVPQVVFGMGANQIPYESYVVSNNDKTLYTEIDTSIAVDSQASAGDQSGATQIALAADVDRYFRRSLSKNGLLLFTDEQALWVGQWLAYLFSKPSTQITAVTIDPLAGPTSWNATQMLEVGMAVQVIVAAPGYAAPVTVLTQIQGVAHAGSRGKARVTYSLHDVFTEHFFQFGDEFSDISGYEMAL